MFSCLWTPAASPRLLASAACRCENPNHWRWSCPTRRRPPQLPTRIRCLVSQDTQLQSPALSTSQWEGWANLLVEKICIPSFLTR